jgi:hypothetical protein
VRFGLEEGSLSVRAAVEDTILVSDGFLHRVESVLVGGYEGVEL